MEILINSKLLTTTLKLVKPLIKRVNLPILYYGLITSNKESITFEVTNLDTSIKQVIPCTVIEQGSCLINLNQLISILGSEKSDIKITSDNEKTQIQIGNTTAKLDFMETCNFPEWVLLNNYIMSDTTNQDLFNAEDVENMNRISYSVLDQDSRFNLNNIAIVDNKIVATDGHRLALEPLSHDFNYGYPVLIPKPICNLIYKTMKKCNVFFEYYNHYIVAYTPHNIIGSKPVTTIVWRRTEGDYPDYKRVIPDRDMSPVTKIVLDKKSLVHAIDQLKAFTTKDNNTIEITANSHLNLSVGTDMVEIITLQKEKCELLQDINLKQHQLNKLESINTKLQKLQTIAVSIPIDKKSGYDFSILIDPDYLSECIKATTEKDVSLAYFKEGSPIRITSYPTDKNYSILMPRRK